MSGYAITLPPGLGYYGDTPHLSPSSLTMFLRCPEQWRHRYMLGLKQPPGAALVRGKADHKAHELNFRQKIDSHTDLPAGDVADAFNEAWREQIDEVGGESGVVSKDPLSKVKDTGYKTVLAYHQSVSPTIQPTEVEAFSDYMIGGVLVHANADVLTEKRGIERKTTSRKTISPKLDHKVQAQTYHTIFGKNFELHYVADSGTITTPDDNPELLVSSPGPIGLVYNRAAHEIVSLYNTFGPNDPWPGAVTHDWSCRFCGYSAQCAYV